MPLVPDYYKVLGVERECADRDIKRAYRAAAKQLHPDLPANKGVVEAAEKFRLVREAYEVLSDPVRRREYDTWGKDPFGESDLPWNDGGTERFAGRNEDADHLNLRTETGSGVASIFEDLFTADPTVVPPRPSKKQQKETPWNPAEMNRRGRMDIRPEEMGGPLPKSKTSGSMPGLDNRIDPERAQQWGFDPEDLAEAALYGDMAAADGFAGGEPGPSPSHASVGSAPRTEDASVDGEDLGITVQVPFLTAIRGGVHITQYRVPDTGGRWSLEDLELQVPAGMEDGGQLRLSGRGHYGIGDGPRGDLLVDVVVEEHAFFRREGNDLVADLPLSPAEAAAGARLEVPTLDGRARVRVPPRVRSGQRIRLKGMGLLDPATGKRGHQQLVVQIQLPPTLTREDVAALQDLDARSGWDPRAAWWEEDG